MTSSIKHAGLSLLFGFLGAFLFSLVHRPPPPAAASTGSARYNSVVTATGFNLVDGSGRLRGQLGIGGEGGPGFWLMDENGVVRVTAGVYGDSTGYIGLQDKQGQMIQLLRSYGPNEAPLLIFKNRGQDKMITGLNPGGEPVPFLLSYESGSRKIHFGEYAGP